MSKVLHTLRKLAEEVGRITMGLDRGITIACLSHLGYNLGYFQPL